MDTQTRVDQALRFFQVNYAGQKVSLARATITDRGKTTQTFHEGEGRLRPGSMAIEGLIRSMIKKSDAGTEIFYAPTPMSGTKGRKKEQALPNVVVFGDADEGLTADAKSKLIELGACLVRSGGIVPATRQPKYHVYLLLTEEVSPEELERLNRGLKVFIRGDKFDSTTLLRIPGTRNHKYEGSPIVTVERYAEARHTPENLIKFLGVDLSAVEAASPTSSHLVMPVIPEGFNWMDNKKGYAKVRNTVRTWNSRFQAGSCRRYMATIAIVKDSLSRGLTIDEAYGFASVCEPLLDKAEEENGYRIQTDVARTWQREAGMKPSGTLTADDIVSTPQNTDAIEKTTTAPPITPPSFSTAVPTFGPTFSFTVPNLDDLLSGDYTPLEPTMVPCGTFALLYPGKSHSLVADRGVGKTHIAIAMVHAIMRLGGRVAYFDFEDSPDTFIRDRMMNQHGITEAMIRNQFLYIGGTSAELEAMDPAESIIMLAEQLGEAKWDLVIIDGVSASMGDLDGDWDGNKDVDYKKWHALMVQPFLDQDIATLQLDHSTKSSPRAGGTMQKGAKLTGVEYQVRQIPSHGFTIGRTGQVILEAVKDRVGRISKHRRTTPPVGHDASGEWPWNDVATFTLESDDEGRIRRAEFEPVNYKDSTEGDTERALPVSDVEMKVIQILVDNGKPMSKSRLRAAYGGNSSAAMALIESMVRRGLLAINRVGRADEVSVVADAPALSSSASGEKDLDFTKADRIPRSAVRTRECRKCREEYDYPNEFAQPDDVGFQVNRPMCKPCAAENIESESYMPRDGAEWARQVRKRKERDDS